VQNAECTCKFGFSVKNGFGLHAACVFNDPIDIQNAANLPLRGTPSFQGEYTVRGIRQSMVGFAFEDIVGYTIDLPFPLDDITTTINMGTIKINASHGKLLKIEECQAYYNDQLCKTCEPSIVPTRVS
jgi:hypothetical protein